MTLDEQIKDIKAELKPNQFIAYKERGDGQVVACAFWNKQKADVKQFGWSEYKEPEAPKAAKKTTTRKAPAKK